MYGKKIIGLGGFNRTKKELKNLSKDIDLIYKHTIKDYRSNSEGIPKVLYFDENKGTILLPIEKLPKKIFYERLKYAKQKEKTIGLGAVSSKKIDIFSIDKNGNMEYEFSGTKKSANQKLSAYFNLS